MAQPSLGRAARELVTYVQLFRDAPNEVRPAATDLRAHLLRALEDFSRDPDAQAVSGEERDAARFALVAAIDECIIRCGWHGADEWTHDLLQQQLFGTNRGGIEFYERLEALPAEWLQAREIFFLCLVLGFEGQLAGDEGARGELIRRQYEMLRVGAVALDAAGLQYLSPPAYETAIEVGSGGARRLWPVVVTWLFGTAAACALLFLVLWIQAGSVPSAPGL